MKRASLLLNLILFSALLSRAYSQGGNLPAPVTINSDTSSSIILKTVNLKYLVENDRALKFPDILKPATLQQFKSATERIKGDVKFVNLWFLYRVKNNTGKPVTIAAYAYSNWTNLYISEDQNNFKHFITGSDVIRSKRDGFKDLYAIPYTMPPNSTITVFERDEGVRSSDVGYGWTMYMADRIIEKENSKNIPDATLAGFFFFAAIFNFFFYYTTREKVYLIFGLCIALGDITRWPYTPMLLGDLPIRYYSLLLSAIVGSAFMCFIGAVILFLRMSKYHPIWKRVIFYGGLLRAFSSLAGGIIICFVGNRNSTYHYLIWLRKSTDILDILLYASIAIVIISDLIKKRTSAQIFILSVLPYLSAAIFGQFVSSIELFSDYTIVWFILVMNWSLFDRFKRLQTENAQHALQREEERNRLMSQQKAELEVQVANRTAELSKSLADLKATQTQLIQSEKMASLGELTAGIAHEIQNPLNFVSNFSEVSTELMEELTEELYKGDTEEAKAISADVIDNLKKINHHSKRADSIVKGMLEHSRTSTGEKQPTDINKLADEYLRLSYQGLRAKDKFFNSEITTQFDDGLPLVNVIPQDIGRVMLNLINNAFYAVNEKQKTAGGNFKPQVSFTTSVGKEGIVLIVKDNGNGIPDNIKDKIMQPFFTTKPTGEGTGLGLSLSYDIVVKGHGGNITVQTDDGKFTEFTVRLPLG